MELAPPRTAHSRAGDGCGRVPAGDPRKFVFGIFDAKSRVWGQFGPENEQFEGQPNEYDVVCRNASVLAFHQWPTIFAYLPERHSSSKKITGTALHRVPAPLHPCL